MSEARAIYKMNTVEQISNNAIITHWFHGDLEDEVFRDGEMPIDRDTACACA